MSWVLEICFKLRLRQMRVGENLDLVSLGHVFIFVVLCTEFFI